MAGIAGMGFAVAGAAAMAAFTHHQRRHVNVALQPGYGLIEIEFDGVTQIGAATWLARTAAAKYIAENVAENVADIVESRTTATAHDPIERGVAMLIIGATFGDIGKHPARQSGKGKCRER